MSYSLSEHRVDVWPLQLAYAESVLPVFANLLAPEEAERQHSFRLVHLQQRYAVVHGALRLVLGRYVNEEAGALRFTSGRNGKPQLDHAGPARFNISMYSASKLLPR